MHHARAQPRSIPQAVGSAQAVWQTVDGFDLKAAIALLDEEVREAVLGTASTALGGAGGGACCKPGGGRSRQSLHRSCWAWRAPGRPVSSPTARRHMRTHEPLPAPQPRLTCARPRTPCGACTSCALHRTKAPPTLGRPRPLLPVPTGAPAAALLATSFISNTLEDFLVVGLAGVASYASVLNLPLRWVRAGGVRCAVLLQRAPHHHHGGGRALCCAACSGRPTISHSRAHASCRGTACALDLH